MISSAVMAKRRTEQDSKLGCESSRYSLYTTLRMHDGFGVGMERGRNNLHICINSIMSIAD